jgi:hypothetical protein
MSCGCCFLSNLWLFGLFVCLLIVLLKVFIYFCFNPLLVQLCLQDKRQHPAIPRLRESLCLCLFGLCLMLRFPVFLCFSLISYVFNPFLYYSTHSIGIHHLISEAITSCDVDVHAVSVVYNEYALVLLSVVRASAWASCASCVSA